MKLTTTERIVSAEHERHPCRGPWRYCWLVKFYCLGCKKYQLNQKQRLYWFLRFRFEIFPDCCSTKGAYHFLHFSFITVSLPKNPNKSKGVPSLSGSSAPIISRLIPETSFLACSANESSSLAFSGSFPVFASFIASIFSEIADASRRNMRKLCRDIAKFASIQWFFRK